MLLALHPAAAFGPGMRRPIVLGRAGASPSVLLPSNPTLALSRSVLVDSEADCAHGMPKMSMTDEPMSSDQDGLMHQSTKSDMLSRSPKGPVIRLGAQSRKKARGINHEGDSEKKLATSRPAKASGVVAQALILSVLWPQFVMATGGGEGEWFFGQALSAESSLELLLQISTIVSLLLIFNVHYLLFPEWQAFTSGRPLLEAVLSSRPVLAIVNKITSVLVKLAMIKEGVPQPDRTEAYSFRGNHGLVDIYEPEVGSFEPDVARPAAIFFHGGAFIFGDRAFGAGSCGWLASHGVVCMSASYRLTNSGAGVAGCIEDAWAVLRWTSANAARLNIDPSRIIITGDSAGGLLATSLAVGLDPNSPEPVERSLLPAAIVANWPATTLGSCSYVPSRGSNGTWLPTSAAKDFRVPNVFVPLKYGHSAEATRAKLRAVLANNLLCYGRRFFGLVPPLQRYPADDAASTSPLRLANSSCLPPMLIASGDADEVVPCDQISRFVEAAQAAGNEVTHIIFEDAGHGEGGTSCAAGRQAVLQFLRHHKLLQGPKREEDDPRDAMGRAMRALNLKPKEYEPLALWKKEGGNTTLRVAGEIFCFGVMRYDG